MSDGGLSTRPRKDALPLLASSVVLMSTIALLMAMPLSLVSVMSFVYVYCIATGTYALLVGSITMKGSLAYRISSKHFLLLSGVILLLIRVPFLLIPIPLSTDVFSYFRFSLLMNGGEIPYVDFYFPYGPLAALLMLPFGSLGSSIAFSYCFRAVMVSFDFLGMLALYSFASSTYGARNAFVLSLLYVTFPVLVIESALNGHVDTVLSASILLAALLNQHRHPRAYAAALIGSIFVRFHMLFACVACLPREFDNREKRPRNVILSLGLTSAFIVLSYYSGFWTPIWNFVSSLAHTLGFVVATSAESWVLSFAAFLLSLISFVGALFSSKRYAPLLLRNCFIALGLLIIFTGLSRFIHAEDILFSRYWWRPPDAEYLLTVIIVLAGVLLVATSRRYTPCFLSSVRSKSLFVLLGIFFLMLSLRTLHGWYTIWLLPFILTERPDRRSLALVLVALVLACSYYEPDLPPSSDIGNLVYDVDLSQASWSLNWSVGNSSISFEAVEDIMTLSAKRTSEGAFGAGFATSLGLSVEPFWTMAVVVASSNSEPYLEEGFDMGVLLECAFDQGETECVLLGFLPNQDLTNESSRTFRYDFRADFSSQVTIKSVSLFVNVTNPLVDLAEYTVSRIAFAQRPVGLSCPMTSALVGATCIIFVAAANCVITPRRPSG